MAKRTDSKTPNNSNISSHPPSKTVEDQRREESESGICIGEESEMGMVNSSFHFRMLELILTLSKIYYFILHLECIFGWFFCEL